jgi:oxygen-dependent protoporphyrinogen oxidase
MKRIAILGGGISGLTAAYELEKARKRGADIDWHLYESSNRLGGIVQTTRQDGFVLEGGPDGWVSEKPWARELAVALGLESELVVSNDATRKTYILIDRVLQAIPDHMRMMVPEDLSALDQSPLFSEEAKRAYAVELTRAEELKEQAPSQDESVASFVLRHFGEEVLTKIAGPLLSGVFGGDVQKLSVRAVMPAFVAMEREYGSLIAALQNKAKSRGSKTVQPIFTTLRGGVATLIDVLIAKLPEERVHLNRAALSLKREGKQWCLRVATPMDKGRVGKSKRHFHHVLLATPVDATRDLLAPLSADAAALLPSEASSAILAAFAWSAEAAKRFAIPEGFGFLVPRGTSANSLLAATFVDQKFSHRAPEGARVVRAFFGGDSADALAGASDEDVAHAALEQLAKILGQLPAPDVTTVARWPRSLPQYEVGHLERIEKLENHVSTMGGLILLGNGLRGVGLPDLVRAARDAVAGIC